MELAVPIVTESAPVVDSTEQVAPAPDSGEMPKLPGYTGQLTKEQKEVLTERIKGDPKFLENFPKGLPELYDAWNSLSSLKGAIKLPAKDAPKEEWDQYYSSIGRPESSDKYTLKKPDVPNEFQYSNEAEKWFRGVAHALNLTQEQASGFFDALNKLQVEALTKVRADNAKAEKEAEQARKTKASEAVNALKQKWGDKFADRWESMKASVNQFATPALLEKAKKLDLDNDPDFLEMFHKIAVRIGPDKMVVSTEDGTGEKPGRPDFNFKDAKRYARED